MAKRRIRRALLKSRTEDPQQELVYLWENDNYRTLFYGHRLPLTKAQKIARSMARFLGIPEPRLSHKRKGKHGNTAEQWGDRMFVNLDKAGWTCALIAHETAHWACDYHGTNRQDHGPGWLGTYLRLLDKYKVLPLHASTHSARLYGLKFMDPTQC